MQRRSLFPDLLNGFVPRTSTRARELRSFDPNEKPEFADTGFRVRITCRRLMNLKDSLVMVGGIGKQDRQDIITGIGIWVLDNTKDWREVSRMPHRFFQGFGELDDVFASSGTDDLIYIH